MTGLQAGAGRGTLRRASVALASVLLLAGCANGATTAGSTTQVQPSPEESAVDHPSSSTSSHPTTPTCGQPFSAPAGAGPTLAGRFPGTVRAGDGQVVGTVELAAGDGAVRAVITPQADAFLVRDGLVVTMPLPQDLGGKRLLLTAGQVEKLPAQAALTPCDPKVAALPAGTYQVYAQVLLNADDGTSRTVVGGPWPVQVS